MSTRIAPLRVSELSPEVRALVEESKLDANQNQVIDQGDAEALRAYSPKDASGHSVKAALVDVATGAADQFLVPRTSEAEQRIRAVVQQAGASDPTVDPTRPASEIRTREIRKLLEDVSPENLRVGEREQLLAALLDDTWVAPVDLWDFGLLADGEEELVARIIESTPERQKAELAARLINGASGGLHALIQARVDDDGCTKRISAALADHVVQASLAQDFDLAMGDIKPTARVEGTERSRTDDAIASVSRHLGREFFPFGGPYQGLSYEAASGKGDTLGPVRLLLHDRAGQTLSLGTINPRNYESAALMFKAVLDRFNEHHYGVAGRLTVPAPWVNLAADLLPATSASNEPAGKALLGTMRWTKLPSTNGQGGQRVFELPVASFAKLVGLPETSALAETEAALVARLKALGVTEPMVRTSARAPGLLQMAPEQAELLLKARAFAKDPVASSLAPAGWDFLRAIDGEVRFVLPLDAAVTPGKAELLRSVDITAGQPMFAVPLPKDPHLSVRENALAAVNERLARFGLGESASTARLGGVEVLTMAPEHARLLMKVARFDFNPHAKAFDTANLYWSARFADLAYLDFATQRPALEAELKRWGFDRFELIAKGGSEVLVASNGKMVMVACRGTQGMADILTDLKGGATSRARPSDAGVPDPTLEQRRLGGRAVRLHTGFAGQVAGVQTEVARAIRSMSEGGALPVWMAGHSKGGAEAGILGLTLQLDGLEIAGGYGLEAARAGDDTFVALAQESGLAQRWVQFQAQKDVVPHVPSTIRGFRTFGTIISPDSVSGHPQWGLTALERFSFARNAIPSGEAFAEHKMGSVLALIGRAYLDTQWTPPVDEPTTER